MNKDEALASAYLLLCEFQETIENSLEGQHPSSVYVDAWLTRYEKAMEMSANLEAAMIEGVPV
jgi:hypothetical protein